MSTLFTIGHSNRSLGEFLRALQGSKIKNIVDVRKIPRSRTNPQFNRETLPDDLAKLGIDYSHAPDLTGLRRSSKQSINTAWRNKSFQAYADYMQTESFENALLDLLKQVELSPTAIMCAEILPWRCHRSLIADAALAHGVEVLDIFDDKTVKPHQLRPFAKVRGKQVYYPGDTSATG